MKKYTIHTWAVAFFVLLASIAKAHPSPNTLVSLSIQADAVEMHLQIPLSELTAAFNAPSISDYKQFVAQKGDTLQRYFLEHITPLSTDGRKWTVSLRSMSVQDVAEAVERGSYQDLDVKLLLQPPTGTSNRQFTLYYDVIMHQVLTHTAIIAIRQDWENGILSENPVEVGAISVDIPTGKVFPIVVNRGESSLWQGFKSIVAHGMQHIAEGTDHLMFLLVLLLAAPLIAEKKRWKSIGTPRYALIRLLKIVTAFTIGHSITLLVGAVGWLRPPPQPVEALIAFSILVSAIQVLRPIFPNKETHIAAFFGLIHGSAFAFSLSDLNLNFTQMALTILGFNLGIELMQVIVILFVMPPLLVLSRGRFYTFIRWFGAIVAIVCATAWLSERLTQKANIITKFIEDYSSYSVYLWAGLVILSIVSHFLPKKPRAE